MFSVQKNLFPAAAVAIAVVLGGCATATPYQSATDGHYGYAEQRIESNRYRITFTGNSDTPKQTVENYLLYRAAELTLQSGFDYFVFASDNTDANTRYLRTFDGYWGWGSYYWGPHSALGLGTSTATPITEYAAQASVVMFAGKKKADDVKAFDAHEVRQNLESAITRPVPPKR